MIVIDPRAGKDAYDHFPLMERLHALWKDPPVRFASGRAELSPDRLYAGHVYDFTIRFTTEENIVSGGSLIFCLPATWTRPVPDAAGQGGGLEVVWPDGVEAEASLWKATNINWVVHLSLRSGTMRQGETLLLRWARVKVQNFPQWNWDNWRNTCQIYVDSLGDGDYRPIKQGYRYLPLVTGEPLASIRVVAPSIAVRGREFRAKAIGIDYLGNPATPAHSGTVYAYTEVPWEPAGTAEMKQNYAEIPVAGEVVAEPGPPVVFVRTEDGMASGKSNPVKLVDTPPEYNLYFGDTHAKTGMTDGLGTPDDYYKHARHGAGLDFAAIADHNWWECSRVEGPFFDRMPDEVFDYIQEAGNRWNRPGEFATLIAIEEYGFEDARGHRNVYYRDSGRKRVFRGARLQELWEFLEGEEAIVIPHHTIIWKHDLRQFNPKYERLVEVYSMHCSSEYKGNPLCNKLQDGLSVQEILATGARLGIIASSDNHNGNPGHSPRPSRFTNLCYSGGLAAVYAPELTREAVYDALKDRRCYGTTGERILLWFELNGSMMGREIQGDGSPRRILVEALGTARVSRVEVIRNNRVVHSVRGTSEHTALEWEDTASLAGDVYYYVRVTQVDGAMAWSSPIWVDTDPA